MRFTIGDFKVYTRKETEELNEKIAMPQSIASGKPIEYAWEYKTRELTIFDGLNLYEKSKNKHFRVINDLFNFIDLIELLKAFNGNKLDTDKIYQISNSFTAKTVSKNDKINLEIHFTGYSFSLYLDKFECSSLAAKFSKILQRCEAWQEQEA